MHERRFSRAVQTINLALLFLLFVGGLWVYPSLPDQIPKHVGTSTVTYWDTTLLRWLVLPLLASGVLILVYVMVYSTARNLEQVRNLHMPNKDLYKTLSHGHKRIVADIMLATLHGMATPLLVGHIAACIHSYLLATSLRTEPLGFMRWWELGPVVIGYAGICLLPDTCSALPTGRHGAASTTQSATNGRKRIRSGRLQF
jgi:hypothetical protein